MICPECGYEFPDECGRYGCPNCCGEGLDPVPAPVPDPAPDLPENKS